MCSRGPRSADPADSRSLPLAVAVTTSPPCTRSPAPQVGTVQDIIHQTLLMVIATQSIPVSPGSPLSCVPHDLSTLTTSLSPLKTAPGTE